MGWEYPGRCGVMNVLSQFLFACSPKFLKKIGKKMKLNITYIGLQCIYAWLTGYSSCVSSMTTVEEWGLETSINYLY